LADGDENRSRDDLSEEASPHRLEKFREEGKVAQSRELTGLLSLLGAGVVLYLMASMTSGRLSEFMVKVFSVDIATAARLTTSEAVKEKAYEMLKLLSLVVLPVAGFSFLLTIAGSYVQVGSVFSFKPLEPDPSRINPIKGLQRMFSIKQFYDGIRLVFRGSVVTLVAYMVLKSEIISVSRFSLMDPGMMASSLGAIGKMVFLALIGVLFVFAGADYWLQKWDFGKNVRLTKQEQKEEHKEHEGDPLIKARIRSVQREMARRRMMEAVKTADVVITNPTHIAVAIKYERDKMDAPKVVAKGADFVAQKIKKLAGDSGIPLVENVPLARALYKSVKVNHSVPRILYQAVAEVLAYVYRLKRKGFETS